MDDLLKFIATGYNIVWIDVTICIIFILLIILGERIYKKKSAKRNMRALLTLFAALIFVLGFYIASSYKDAPVRWFKELPQKEAKFFYKKMHHVPRYIYSGEIPCKTITIKRFANLESEYNAHVKKAHQKPKVHHVHESMFTQQSNALRQAMKQE